MMMHEADSPMDAAVKQDGILSERIETIIEKFYILSYDLEREIADTLALSDTMGLKDNAITHDISSVKRNLDAMKLGVVVNLDLHLNSLQRKMTNCPQMDMGEGSGCKIPIGTTNHPNGETFDHDSQASVFHHIDEKHQNFAYYQQQNGHPNDGMFIDQHNATFSSQPQHRAFDGNPSGSTNTPFLSHLQQQRTDNSQFASHDYYIHDQPTAGRALNINQRVRPDSYEGSMAYLSGDNNMTQDESLSHSHTETFCQAPDIGSAQTTLTIGLEVGCDSCAASATARDHQYHHKTVAQPSASHNKLPSTVTKVEKPRSKRVGRLSISQTRYSRQEDLVIAKEFAKAAQKATNDKVEIDKIETARGIAAMLKNMPGGRDVSGQSVATRYWRMTTNYKGASLPSLDDDPLESE